MGIQSLIGYLLYLLRRNDISWNRLKASEQELVLEANRLHNNTRPTYANPELYKEGETYDSHKNRLESLEGELLQQFLIETHPTSVIEFGPGGGFYTKSIAEFPSVSYLTCIDIVEAFLTFLKPRLEELRSKKESFDFKLIHGDFLEANLEPSDAIIFISTVHHIPNRLELLRKVEKSLRPGGRCFIFEPTHYLPRLSYLLHKFATLYAHKDHRSKIANLSTHHFCTLEEFESVCKQTPGISINAYGFYRLDFPRFARKAINRLLTMLKFSSDRKGSIYVVNRRSWLRHFSQRMSIELIKS